jgi:hypothetical protein
MLADQTTNIRSFNVDPNTLRPILDPHFRRDPHKTQEFSRDGSYGLRPARSTGYPHACLAGAQTQDPPAPFVEHLDVDLATLRRQRSQGAVDRLIDRPR